MESHIRGGAAACDMQKKGNNRKSRLSTMCDYIIEKPKWARYTHARKATEKENIKFPPHNAVSIILCMACTMRDRVVSRE